MKNYQEKFSQLSERLNQASQEETPLQQVSPLPEKKAKEEQNQLNVWLPKSLYKKLKMHSVEEEKTIREITIEALNEWFERQEAE